MHVQSKSGVRNRKVARAFRPCVDRAGPTPTPPESKVIAQREFVTLCVALALCVVLAGCSSPSRPQLLSANDPTLNAVSWLAGTWGSEDGQARSEEHWTQPSGGTMIGMN